MLYIFENCVQIYFKSIVFIKVILAHMILMKFDYMILKSIDQIKGRDTGNT